MFSHHLQLFFPGRFNVPMFLMHCVPQFCISKISNFLQFSSLERLQREQFWYKMASGERLLISTCFVVYYYHHLLVSCATKLNVYQGRGVHVTGVSAAYTFKLNKNILSE
jgi:hypothetical protein